MHRPLPEAIRGCWYLVNEPVASARGGSKPLQVLTFRLDGSFSRHTLREQTAREAERGSYTFDGSFLILRGRTTETYRVYPRDFWKWSLEDRKDELRLMRGLVADTDFFELSADDQKEIRILPIRVAVRNDSDSPELVHDLVYRPADRDPVRIGAFFVERHDDGNLWVGLTPYARGLELRTWERIVRDCYLDIYCGKPQDVGVVTVRMLDSNDSRVFNYRAP